jgi:hypothetical protein
VANVLPDDIVVREFTQAVYQWPDTVPFQSAPRDTVVEKSFRTAIRAEMSRETWEAMLQVWISHQQHIQNPAVRDAWDQYLVVRALADKNRPVLLRK